MAGEPLAEATLTATGIAGDRLVHVEDQRGRVISARTHPHLLALHVTLAPDGEPWVDGRPWNASEVTEAVRGAAGPSAHLVRNDVRQSRFSQSRRSRQQNMVERFAPFESRFDINP